MRACTRLRVLPADIRRAWGIALGWATLAAALDAASGVLLVPLLVTWFSQGIWPRGWLLGLAGVTVAHSMVMYVALRRGYLAGGSLAAGIVGHLLQHLPRLDPRALRKVASPQSLLRGPVLQSMAIPAHLLGPLISAVLTPACVVLGLFLVDARIAWALLLAGLLCMLLLRWSSQRTRAAEETRAATEQAFGQQVQAFATQQALLRAAGQGSAAAQDLAHALDGLRDSTTALLRRSLPVGLGFSLTVQGIFATMLLGGVWAVEQGHLDGALLTAVLLLLVRFLDPLTQLAHLDQALRGGWRALDTLLQVLALPPLNSPDQGEPPADSSLSAQTLECQREDGHPWLSVRELWVPAGSLTVIVGPSGAGKSSLLALLGRLGDPDQGCVRIGRIDARRLSEESLARSRNMVFQDSGVFRGSIVWNLRMAKADAQPQEMRQAAQSAGLLAEIELWPQQWETPVGPGGSLLSGGQRQRLCLARAFLSPAPLLLLDEPTASLDALSETQVIQSLAALRGQRTVVAVTHKPALARLADQVLVLKDGQLHAQGTHAQLCASNPWYAEFAGQLDQTEPQGI